MGKRDIMFTADHIEKALNFPLPGFDAQSRMAPSHREMAPPPGARTPEKGGVLLLLYPGNERGELFTVLTVRTENVAVHKGQVSLPGGGSEPADRSIVHTAIREACEEVGLCGEDIRIIGSLTPLYIGPSNFFVYPCVASVPYRPSFVLQESEVSIVLEVPIRHFLDRENITVEDWHIGGMMRRVPYFNVYGHKVWGATAIILSEFTAVLEGLIAGGRPCGVQACKGDG